MEPTGKPLLDCLQGIRQERPPFWLMRQAGRYLPEYRALREKAGSFLDLCFAPGLAAEATLQPIRRFGMDAAILFSDILLIPQAMGQKLRFEASGGPKLEAIGTDEQAKALSSHDVAARLGAVYEAIRRVKAALAPETALIGFVGAPWTLATYMVEGGTSRMFSKVKAWAEADASGFDRLIEKLVEATGAHLVAQIDSGADVVQIFDTWAGVVAAGDFERLVIEPTRRIVEAVRRRHANVPIVGFPRGIGPLYRRYFVETGVTALSLDTNVSLEDAQKLQQQGPVQGNLDPKTLVDGSPRLELETRTIVDALNQNPFVFNLGHGVLPETPVENVAMLARLVRGR